MSIEMAEDEGNPLNLSEADTRAKLIDPAFTGELFTETKRRMFAA